MKSRPWLTVFVFLAIAPALHAEQVFIKRLATPVAPGLGLPQAEVVRKAPVHAELRTRSVRDLCDGNRIVNEQVETLYRDSKGRERREHAEGGVTVVLVRDGKRHFMLEPHSKLVIDLPGADHKGIQTFGWTPAPEIDVEVEGIDVEGAGALGEGAEVKVVRKALHGTVVAPAAPLPAIPPGPPLPGLPPLDFVELLAGEGLGGETEVEPLGQKKIDGVRVEGTRHTTTFEAGAFGNEKPIEVVKTTWYSPELRMMIRSEEHDPRSGTVTYEAKVHSREEPDAALFDVPEGYRSPEDVQPQM